MNTEIDPTPSFWSQLGRAFVKLLRLVLILAVIAGIGAGIYFGAPYLYEKFILPVETNTARLNEVESKQAADMNQLSGQVADLKTRLTELEMRQTERAQSLAELQGQVQALGITVDAYSETLDQLASMQAVLDNLSAANETFLVGENSALANLQHQVTLSRSIDLLSRANLYLSQRNLGLVKQDIQSARDLLAGLQADIPADKAASLQGVIARLDLALGNLPASPDIVADDVNIAWQLLVESLPDFYTQRAIPAPATVTPAPTAGVPPTATP